MTGHKTGTRDGWPAARLDLLKAEKEFGVRQIERHTRSSTLEVNMSTITRSWSISTWLSVVSLIAVDIFGTSAPLYVTATCAVLAVALIATQQAPDVVPADA